MEVKRTVPVKLDVPDQRCDDFHRTVQQFDSAANYTIDHGRGDDGDLIRNRSIIRDEVSHAGQN
jgi:putative transposase